MRKGVKEYPFQKPTVYVYNNNKEIKYLESRKYCNFPRIVEAMKILNNKNFIKDLPLSRKVKKNQKIKSQECLCCNSILCDWTPALVMEKIAHEIMMINQIKKQIKVILELNEVSKKYKIPYDNQVEIISYLY